MSGTTWAVLYDGAVLTWQRLQELYTAEAKARGGRGYAPLREVATFEFDTAEYLSSVQAQALVLWLREWLPHDGRGHLRLVPSIPTHEVARAAPQKLSAVRI